MRISKNWSGKVSAGSFMTARGLTRRLSSNERLLFCSDGLHGALDDQLIRDLLGSAQTIEEITQSLVQLALEKDGKDNITALVVEHAV